MPVIGTIQNHISYDLVELLNWSDYSWLFKAKLHDDMSARPTPFAIKVFRQNLDNLHSNE